MGPGEGGTYLLHHRVPVLVHVCLLRDRFWGQVRHVVSLQRQAHISGGPGGGHWLPGQRARVLAS